MKNNKLLLSTLGLSVALSFSTAVVAPEPVHAFDLKKATNNFKKNTRKLRNNVKKTRKKIKRAVNKPSTKRILQGAGVALVAGGLLKDSPAAAIIGVALVAAPEIFKKDIAKSYGKDLNWSGCTRCTNKKPRAVTVPGRKVSKKKQKESIARVKEDIKDVQLALKELGLYKKRIDGDFGPGTRAGVKEFQRSLNAEPTGTLSAEQRYRLFIQAEQKGYQRQAVLNVIDDKNKKSVSAVPLVIPAVVTSQENTISEYLLAKSQFENFNEQYLKSGDQTMVTSARLLPDGKIELEVKDASGQKSKTVTGIVNDIAINPHKLSDQWIRIVYQDGSMSEPLTLNTRDDFPSTEAATNWMVQANSKINILSKLTEVEPRNVKVRVAGSDAQEPVVNKANTDTSVPVNVATGQNVSTTEATRPSSSEINNAPKVQVSLNNNNAETNTKTNTLTGFGTQVSNEICQQNIYLSFDFPEGEDDISHYNVVPPEGTIMIDNGDGTAYFTGSCIQGNYDYSYVFVQKAQQQSDWKHSQIDGSFQIASNSEQCSIDLNQPEKSASLQCF